MHCTWFTNVHKCPRVMTLLQWTQVSRQMTIPKKERSAWCAGPTSKTQHLSSALLQVLSSNKSPSQDMALPEVSDSLQWGWTLSRALQIFYRQPEETLLPVYAGNTQHMQGEPPLQRAHPSQMSPPGWQCHPGVLPANLCPDDRTLFKEQSPQAHLCSHTHRRATGVPPVWSPLIKAQDVTAP